MTLTLTLLRIIFSVIYIYLFVCLSICMFTCLTIYFLDVHSQLGGSNIKAYFVVKPNLTHNLCLLGILEVIILLPNLRY